MTLPPSAPPPPGPEGADPSMEEILASIRRILNEDDPNAAPDEQPAVPVEDDVLVLDHSMLVAAPEPVLPHAGPGRAEAARPDAVPAEPEPAHLTGEPVAAALPAAPEPADEPPAQLPVALAIAAPEPAAAPAPVAEPAPPPQPGPQFGHGLVAAETAAAAASSVDDLLRTLAASRATQVYRGGPTIEDLVREEVRPLLKHWLDTNLPPLVERLVRAEIERVVGRALP